MHFFLRVVDSLRKISLAVAAGGRASHQLESGMYFTKSNPGGEMEELRMAPLNEITDNKWVYDTIVGCVQFYLTFAKERTIVEA